MAHLPAIRYLERKNKMTEIQKELFKLQDLTYRNFHSRLMPNISIEKIIGVRNPETKKFAKQLIKEGRATDFVSGLPHKYYEENNVHAYIINECKDYKKAIEMLNEFLPFVNNWATCDIINPKIFKKYGEELLNEIEKWISSKETYTIRFGIKMLMTFYLDENFKKEYLKIPAEIKSEEYYINMMIAWFYATALAKQYDETIKYLENKKLDEWIHNKTIQKAVESYRITDKQKEYLRSLRIKK